jgi:hypothetical protein
LASWFRFAVWDTNGTQLSGFRLDRGRLARGVLATGAQILQAHLSSERRGASLQVAIHGEGRVREALRVASPGCSGDFYSPAAQRGNAPVLVPVLAHGCGGRDARGRVAS